ncbi:hypothetical protein M8494_13380 [Serratia ureilytica]
METTLTALLSEDSWPKFRVPKVVTSPTPPQYAAFYHGCIDGERLAFGQVVDAGIALGRGERQAEQQTANGSAHRHYQLIDLYRIGVGLSGRGLRRNHAIDRQPVVRTVGGL